MQNSKKISEFAYRYLKGSPTERIPERVQTLGDVELETKINIKNLNDVEGVLNNIKLLGFSKVTHRKEWHHFFLIILLPTMFLF